MAFLPSAHDGHPRLAAQINQTRGRGIMGVTDCGSHNPVHGTNYWKCEPDGNLLYYSDVVVSEGKEGEAGTQRNAIYRVVPSQVSPELLD